MYRLLYRVVLRRVPPEAAHLAAFGLLLLATVVMWLVVARKGSSH